MISRHTHCTDNVGEPDSGCALFLFHNLPKGVQHEQIGAQVIPAGVAEGGCEELPPVGRSVGQVQGADPGHSEQEVCRKDAQIEEYEPEDALR